MRYLATYNIIWATLIWCFAASANPCPKKPVHSNPSAKCQIKATAVAKAKTSKADKLAIQDPLIPDQKAGAEMTPQGKNIRGVFLPYPKLRAWSPSKIVRWVKRAKANAVIMDIKDDRGRVTFIKPTSKRPSNHGEVKQMGKILEALHKENIYAIGRLVCFKDNLFAKKHPSVAVKNRKTGKTWRDRGNLAWVDPHSEIVHKHIVSIAKAAEEIGFDEVQLDYIRFPVEPESRFANFPAKRGKVKRHQTIATVLAKVDRAIGIPLSIDVFGLTAYHPGDTVGLGQSLEHLAPYIDAISPMVYLANWPRRVWEKPNPKKTHRVIQGAVIRIKKRLGNDIVIRPLLQAFSWRAKNFGTSFILNQIDAAVSGGASGHLFWNQSGKYAKVALVWGRLDNIDLKTKAKLAKANASSQTPLPTSSTKSKPKPNQTALVRSDAPMTNIPKRQFKRKRVANKSLRRSKNTKKYQVRRIPPKSQTSAQTT